MQIGKTIERIKELAAKDNLIITKNALETLAKLSNGEEILKRLSEKDKNIITMEVIEEFLPKPKIPAAKQKVKEKKRRNKQGRYKCKGIEKLQ